MKKFLLFILCLAVAAAAIWYFFGNDIVRFIYPQKYAETVEKYCEQDGVHASLVYAVIKAESGFRESVVSSKGAYGLMQVTEETMEWLREKYPDEFSGITIQNLTKPENNIALGVRLLRLNLEKYGNTQVALAAYNAGMGRVDGWLADSRYSSDAVTLHKIPYIETADYVEKCVRYYNRYTEIYEREEE